MSNNGAVKGTKRHASANTPANAVAFLVEQMIRGTVNTAEVVKVVAVTPGGPDGPAGYVDVLPLVTQTDAWNNAIAPAALFHIPYARIQGGIAALVIDPVPGDIGVAVFAKRDSSGVTAGTTEPVKPGSFREFDQSDGFYLGGYLNQKPTCWLELRQDNTAVLKAPAGVTIDAPETHITGNVTIDGNTNIGGNADIDGNTHIGGKISVDGNGGAAFFTGGFTNTGGQVTSNGVTLETHTHGGVQTGGGNTAAPNGGA
jgi:hypothetical protein